MIAGIRINRAGLVFFRRGVGYAPLCFYSLESGRVSSIPLGRKLFGILPIMIGLWCLCFPAAGVWQIKQMDLGWKYQQRLAESLLGKEPVANPLLNSRNAPKGLEEFVVHEVGKTRKEVHGEAWEALFAQAKGSGAGPGRSGEYLYLPAGTSPLNELEDSDYPLYTLEVPGKYPVFLFAGFMNTDSAIYTRSIPWSMTHPYSWVAPWLLGVGVLIYSLLPWRRRKENEATYIRWRSVIGPDVLGVFLAGTFMVLPLLIMPQISSHPRPLSFAQGDAWFSLIFWFIASIGVGNFVIATWYEGLRFEINPEGISKVNLMGKRQFAFNEMEMVKPLHWTPPKWFKMIAWLVVLMNWQLAGVLLGAHEVNFGLEIPCRDGSTLKIWVARLNAYEDILEALHVAGVPFEEVFAG